MTIYQGEEVGPEVIEVARAAREIYLRGYPRTHAEPWDALSSQDQHAWIPYAMAAVQATAIKSAETV